MPSQQSDIARLLAIDAILIKAANLGGTEALFLNLERRMLQMAKEVWQDRVNRAVKAVRANVMYGMEPKAISAAIRKAFKGWQNELEPIVSAVTRDAYVEGKRQILMRSRGLLAPLGKGKLVKLVKAMDVEIIGILKAPKGVETTFGLRDERAVDQLIEGQLHWVGEYYDSQLSESIDELVNETMISTGLGRQEAGRLLEARLLERLAVAGATIPEGWGKGPAAYFELLAANSASNARVRGSLGQMAEIGVTKYAITSVGDERTCGRCKVMDGRTFETRHAAALMGQIADAETPEQAKRLHPWANKTSEIEANPNRFPFPPFHGECRCTVDISDDSEITFDPLPGW